MYLFDWVLERLRMTHSNKTVEDTAISTNLSYLGTWREKNTFHLVTFFRSLLPCDNIFCFTYYCKVFKLPVAQLKFSKYNYQRTVPSPASQLAQ